MPPRGGRGGSGKVDTTKPGTNNGNGNNGNNGRNTNPRKYDLDVEMPGVNGPGQEGGQGQAGIDSPSGGISSLLGVNNPILNFTQETGQSSMVSSGYPATDPLSAGMDMSHAKAKR